MELVTDQGACDAAFRRWADAMVAGATQIADGWVVEGTGIGFTNYGHGKPGVVKDQIMLGSVAEQGNGVVKIVLPRAAGRDRGRLTVAARDRSGRTHLLRAGWLKKNPISREVRTKFARLTGLGATPLTINGVPSGREWFDVADVDADQSLVVADTVAFAQACARARAKAGGGTAVADRRTGRAFGLDEKGRVRTVTLAGGTKEVEELQGFVWERLHELLGRLLTKPGRNGHAVDGLVRRARLLIEIKTGTSAADIYGAVGQLALYPSLVDLPPGLDKVLLVPDRPAIRPQMAAALAAADVQVFHYSVGRSGRTPEIEFTPVFLAHCRTRRS